MSYIGLRQIAFELNSLQVWGLNTDPVLNPALYSEYGPP